MAVLPGGCNFIQINRGKSMDSFALPAGASLQGGKYRIVRFIGSGGFGSFSSGSGSFGGFGGGDFGGGGASGDW